MDNPNDMPWFETKSQTPDLDVSPATCRSAGIEYHGSPGTTASCIEAVERLLLYGPSVSEARLLTSDDRRHALLLRISEVWEVAIRSGFTSGYSGEGPRGLAHVLRLLGLHRIDIGEVVVPADLLHRLDLCVLTEGDLAWLVRQRPKHGPAIYDYIHPFDRNEFGREALWRGRPPVIPFPAIDERLLDLAIGFWGDPDAALMKAFRRLEEIVRDRLAAAGMEVDGKTGAKLFATAFHGDDAPLTWPGVPDSEKVGRANLFAATFAMFRNARAHREDIDDPDRAVLELLAVNQLYRLEGMAVSRD